MANVGGQPVAHGLLSVEGERKQDAVANLVLTVKDGKFDSEAEGFSGITSGECQAHLHIYQDEDGNVPLGSWEGVISVPTDGSATNVDAPADAVSKAPKQT